MDRESARRSPVARKPGDEPGFNFAVFRDTAPTKSCVAFRDKPMPKPANRPAFNTTTFGPLIAPRILHKLVIKLLVSEPNGAL